MTATAGVEVPATTRVDPTLLPEIRRYGAFDISACFNCCSGHDTDIRHSGGQLDHQYFFAGGFFDCFSYFS